jgi:hypothetical protein
VVVGLVARVVVGVCTDTTELGETATTDAEEESAPFGATVNPAGGGVKVPVAETTEPAGAAVEPAGDTTAFMEGSKRDPSARTIEPVGNPTADGGE